MSFEQYMKTHKAGCYCVKTQNAKKAIDYLIERNIRYVKKESTFGRTQIHIRGTLQDIEKVDKAFVNISKECESDLLYGEFDKAELSQAEVGIFKFFAVIGMGVVVLVVAALGGK